MPHICPANPGNHCLGCLKSSNRPESYSHLFHRIPTGLAPWSPCAIGQAPVSNLHLPAVVFLSGIFTTKLHRCFQDPQADITVTFAHSTRVGARCENAAAKSTDMLMETSQDRGQGSGLQPCCRTIVVLWEETPPLRMPLRSTPHRGCWNLPHLHRALE